MKPLLCLLLLFFHACDSDSVKPPDISGTWYAKFVQHEPGQGGLYLEMEVPESSRALEGVYITFLTIDTDTTRRFRTLLEGTYDHPDIELRIAEGSSTGFLWLVGTVQSSERMTASVAAERTMVTFRRFIEP